MTEPVTGYLALDHPDTPENIAAAILATLPRKREAWRYLQDDTD